MKKNLLVLLGLVSVVGAASASNDFSYTATGNPGGNPDGVDQSSNPLQVWTVITTPGGLNGQGDSGADGSGVYFGNPDGSGGIGGGSVNSWQAYSYQNDGVALGGSVNSYNAFSGGALGIGQTVSINFVMRAVDPAANGLPAGEVGVSLLSGTGGATGSSPAVTFYVFGGGNGGYYYSDAGTTGGSPGSMGYQYQSAFNIAFTETGPNSYSAVAGSDHWSGTFSGSLAGVDVFNDAGGNGSDVGFNNLTVSGTVVPEPTTIGMLISGGLVLLGCRRGFRRV